MCFLKKLMFLYFRVNFKYLQILAIITVENLERTVLVKHSVLPGVTVARILKMNVQGNEMV